MSSKTPFFQAFGPLLFGRAAPRLMRKLGRFDSLQELYELFGHLLPEHLLAASEAGVNSRERVFSTPSHLLGLCRADLESGYGVSGDRPARGGMVAGNLWE